MSAAEVKRRFEIACLVVLGRSKQRSAPASRKREKYSGRTDVLPQKTKGEVILGFCIFEHKRGLETLPSGEARSGVEFGGAICKGAVPGTMLCYGRDAFVELVDGMKSRLHRRSASCCSAKPPPAPFTEDWRKQFVLFGAGWMVPLPDLTLTLTLSHDTPSPSHATIDPQISPSLRVSISCDFYPTTTEGLIVILRQRKGRLMLRRSGLTSM